MYIKSTILILLSLICLVSCGDPADEVINVLVNLESEIPVRVGDFEWEKEDGVWTSYGKIHSGRCILVPAEPSDYKAISKYMSKQD